MMNLMLDNRLTVMSSDITGILSGMDVRMIPALNTWKEGALSLRKQIDAATVKQAELNTKWSQILVNTENTMRTFASQYTNSMTIRAFTDTFNACLQSCINEKEALILEINHIEEQWVSFNANYKQYRMHLGVRV